MANDNLIQEVINDLSYEITQLKYKNETNVTMRIDTVIEFLEQVKDDVIKAQQNQKFDLHRTATNCTITILDEENEPISDGSNKLTYGDVIKISVVASEGYEDPTISVNGLPFTSGNTMVVKTDLYIVGNATASVIPIAVGQTFSNGDKIHFDTSKVSDFGTFVENATIDEDMGVHLMVLGTYNDASTPFMYIVAEGGTRLVLAGSAEGDNVLNNVVYSTQAIPDTEIVQGFNNLDENDDFVLLSANTSLPITITNVYDTTPPTWNGVIISKG